MPSWPSATTTPWCTLSSTPLRDVTATGTNAVRCDHRRAFRDLASTASQTRWWRTSVSSLLMTWWRSPHSLIERLGHRRRRAGRARHRLAPSTAAPAERRAERQRRVQLHRAGRDARREHVVLDLLVDDDRDQHDHRLERRVEERQQHRQDAGEVRADDRQELADDADPQRQRDGRRRAERLEHDPVEQWPRSAPAAPASRGSRRSCCRPAPTSRSTRSWRAGVSRLQIARRIFGPSATR